jgi:hypothetical protein
MRQKSAEFRPEKGPCASVSEGWVGEFPCRGQEAPQRALLRSVDEGEWTVKPRAELSAPTHCNVVLKWFAELKNRASR